MKKSGALVLLIAVLGIAASASAEPDFARLSNDDLLSSDYTNDQPSLSVADTMLAIDRGVLTCQTDDVTGSHIYKRTVCDLVDGPPPVGTHYKFQLFQEGLYPMLCELRRGCRVHFSARFNSHLPTVSERTN